MLNSQNQLWRDADILLYVTDVIEDPEKNMDFLEKVAKMSIPVILLINKIDESDQKEAWRPCDEVAWTVTKC